MAKNSKELKVEFFKPGVGHLNEIYQPTGIRFALCGPPNEENVIVQTHEWVKCRDFMPDAVRAQLTGEIFEIYGFKYDPKKNPPIDLNKVRMLVSKAELKTEKDKADFEKSMESGLKILNTYERLMGLKTRSKFRYVKGDKSPWIYCWLFTGPKEWLKSPYLLSLYSFCIRLGVKNLKFDNVDQLVKEMKKCGDQGNERDNNYLKKMWNRIHLILKERKNLFLQNGKMDPIFTENVKGSFHDKTGIVSLCTAQTLKPELNKKLNELFRR